MNIHDISYLLSVLRKNQNQGVFEKFFWRFFHQARSGNLRLEPIEYTQLYDLGIKLKLFVEKKKKIFLTSKGKSVSNMNSKIDLTPEQKNYLVENCIFGNNEFESEISFLKKFKFHEKFGYVFVSNVRKDIEQISLLSQFDLIQKKGEYWVLNSDYVEYIENVHEVKTNFITQNQLEKILTEQKVQGELAERLTVEYEKKRLKKKKMVSESKKVEQISSKFANKGYDVESFSRKSDSPNLFIEVKSRKWDSTSFIISINEINTAKRLGKRYAIYFWNNMGADIKPKEPTKIIIDPFKKLSFGDCKNCLNFLLEI